MATTAPIDKVAWIVLRDGRILGARTRGRDTFYIPGGKREPGESDLETLAREAREELDVELLLATACYAGTFEAQAHARPPGVMVRLTCYTADYTGTLAPCGEIAETAWLGFAHRPHAPPADRLVFDYLHARHLLA